MGDAQLRARIQATYFSSMGREVIKPPYSIVMCDVPGSSSIVNSIESLVCRFAVKSG
jgi:hypothetical protein